MDARWEETREFCDRLRWARQYYAHKQGDIIFRPTDAAVTLGEKPVTYRTWEQNKDHGGREPPMGTVKKIGQKFGVNWLWLLTGEGSPHYDPALNEYIRLVTVALPEVPEPERARALAAMRAVLESFARKAS